MLGISFVHVETTMLRPVPTNEYQELRLRPDASPPLQSLNVISVPFSFDPVVTNPSGSIAIAFSQLFPLFLLSGSGVGRGEGSDVGLVIGASLGRGVGGGVGLIIVGGRVVGAGVGLGVG
jgi:hypothetical protein